MLVKGFTLIELMVVIAILGILYALALPAYTAFVQDGRRADVQRELLQNVAILERKYTRSGGYPSTYNIASSQYYSFNYTVVGTTAFTLSAVPITGSSQGDDPCKTLSVNHRGVKTADQASCWG